MDPIIQGNHCAIFPQQASQFFYGKFHFAEAAITAKGYCQVRQHFLVLLPTSLNIPTRRKTYNLSFR